MTEEKKALEIGFIMPIAAIDGCSADHWLDVKSIITEAVASITKYKCTSKIVSESEDVGVIQKRIVQNVYNADVIVCDVSCKNANVMFELGMRLAFDKPTIIIKDELTGFSFDTQVIEHLIYPRDLRFSKIVNFKEQLAKKIVATYDDSISNPDHSTFLKNFGQFKVAALGETTVTADNLMLTMLNEMQTDLAILKRNSRQISSTEKHRIDNLNSIGSIIEGLVFNYLSSSNHARGDEIDLSELIEYVKYAFNSEYPKFNMSESLIITLIKNILKDNGFEQAS